MAYILIKNKPFGETAYDNEAELEEAVFKNKKYIFGKDVVYIPHKLKTGAKTSKNTGVPDSFLVDFSNPVKPQLFFVECELESHRLYEHIGPQIMRFYASFETGKRQLQVKLTDVIKKDPGLKKEIETHLKDAPFDNIDSLLNYLTWDNTLGIVVVIDEQTEDLNSLLKRIAPVPEVVELKKYQYNNETVYQYNPFRDMVSEPKELKKRKLIEYKDVDTIVCPAREDGFKHAFLDNDAWWAIRISSTVIPSLKYIAMYETQPISAIRWMAKIKKIEPYKNTGKNIVYVEDKKRLKQPIKLDEGKISGVAPQASRYTNHEKLVSAKKISDLWYY